VPLTTGQRLLVLVAFLSAILGIQRDKKVKNRKFNKLRGVLLYGQVQLRDTTFEIHVFLILEGTMVDTTQNRTFTLRTHTLLY
jgi:hypothetical protein